MTLEFVPLLELPAAKEGARAGLHLAGFGGYLDRLRLRAYRKLKIVAPYVGIYAVADGEPVGQTLVLRVPYRFGDHVETIAGIAAVTTRPDWAGQGIARQVLEEVHRREQADGIRYSMLWTNPSWKAHDLYERLGYRDVYTPPLATRIIDRRRKVPAGWTVRAATMRELPTLDQFHNEVAQGRSGFARRLKRSFEVERKTNNLELKHLKVVRRRGALRAYAYMGVRWNVVECGEIIARDPEARQIALDAVEASAKVGQVCAISHGAVSDGPDELIDRGYAIIPRGWFTLLGRSPTTLPSDEAARATFRTTDPEYCCYTFDRF